MGLFEIIGGLFSGGAQLYAAKQQAEIEKKNFALQKEKFDYDKALQQTMFQREDTSVQRRMADLQSAGLSKTLAAGSSAQAGPVISTIAPQMGTKSIEYKSQAVDQALGIAMDMARQRADISKTAADMALSQETARGVALKNFAQSKENAIIDQNLGLDLAIKSASLTGKQIQNENQLLDKEIKRQGIDLNEIEKTKGKIAIEGARLGLDAQHIDIAAKRLALQNQEYNTEWYKNVGMPIGASLSEKALVTGVVGNALKKQNKDTPIDLSRSVWQQSEPKRRSRYAPGERRE